MASNMIQGIQTLRKTKPKFMETISGYMMRQWRIDRLECSATKIPLGRRQMTSLWQPKSCMTHDIVAGDTKKTLSITWKNVLRDGRTGGFSARTQVNKQRRRICDSHMNHNLSDERTGSEKKAKRNELLMFGANGGDSAQNKRKSAL